MKKHHIALLIACIAHDIYTLDKLYADLKKNPAFQTMSLVEIAVEREDMQAVRHFAPSSSKEEIIKGIQALKAKIDFTKQKIEDLKHIVNHPSGAVALAEKRQSFYNHIRELESTIDALNNFIR